MAWLDAEHDVAAALAATIRLLWAVERARLAMVFEPPGITVLGAFVVLIELQTPTPRHVIFDTAQLRQPVIVLELRFKHLVAIGIRRATYLAKLTTTLRSRSEAVLKLQNGANPEAFKVPIVQQSSVKKAKKI